MKNSILACFLLAITFMWDVPDTGNPPVGYVVELADRFGQVVETATVTTNTYTTGYEGTLLLSVSALDGLGGQSVFSEWSNLQISDTEKNYLTIHANKAHVRLLFFISTYAETMAEVWEDPHEGN